MAFAILHNRDDKNMEVGRVDASASDNAKCLHRCICSDGCIATLEMVNEDTEKEMEESILQMARSPMSSTD